MPIIPILCICEKPELSSSVKFCDTSHIYSCENLKPESLRQIPASFSIQMKLPDPTQSRLTSQVLEQVSAGSTESTKCFW